MLLIVRRAGYTRDDAEHGAESVVHAVNRVRNPAAASAVPAFALQNGVERSARSGGSGGGPGVENAGVSFFLERGFAEKFLGVGIAGERAFALGTVTRFMPVFRGLHPANSDV